MSRDDTGEDDVTLTVRTDNIMSRRNLAVWGTTAPRGARDPPNPNDLDGQVVMFQSKRQGRNNENHFIKAKVLSNGGRRARHYPKYVYSGDPARASTSLRKYMWIIRCNAGRGGLCAIESYYYPGRFMTRSIHDEHSRKRIHVTSATFVRHGMEAKFLFAIYGELDDAIVMSRRVTGRRENMWGDTTHKKCYWALLQTHRADGNRKILGKDVNLLGIRQRNPTAYSTIFDYSGQSCRFNIHRIAPAHPSRL